MAQYGYIHRGYSGNDGDQQQEWRNTSYTGNIYSDQTYKPVLVDAAESLASPRYVKRVEAYVQEVQGTVFMKMEPPRDYGVANGGWGGPVYDSPQRVNEFPIIVRSEANRLTRTIPPSNTRNWHQAPDSTFEDHGTNQWSSSKNADDRKVRDLITKVANWRLPSDSVAQTVSAAIIPRKIAIATYSTSQMPSYPNGGQRYGDNEIFKVNQPSYSTSGQRYGDNEVFKGNQPSNSPSGQRYGDNEVFKGNQPSYPNGSQRYGDNEVFKVNQPSYSTSGQRYGDNEVFKGNQPSYPNGNQRYGDNEVFKVNQPSYSTSGQRYGDNEVFKGNQPSYPNGGKSTNTNFDYNDGESDTTMQGGTLYTSGSWSRASQPTILSSATNDITEAVLLLQKAIQPSPQAAANAAPMARQPRFTRPRQNAMQVAISNDEAQRSYFRLDPSSRAYQEGDDYLSGRSRRRQNNRGTIDSTEALFKYNGEVIP
ncbi:hypothetical protein Nepgr_021227 [Nepenthes gracilis]|uniref:Uncharacterized protein n=1 Tax=Nepenthes gracilis TaxID=150966 RepID=A0AAD3T0G3_NEPGR|nr:hypothetical protein Nepgr_021227 [Nepenthes gracilis]